MGMSTAILQQQLAALVARSCQEISTARLWKLVSQAYQEPHRHYHNLDHIRFMLAGWEAHGPRDDAVAWAIWFHDVVYDPRATENEAASAACFRRELGPFLERTMAADVERLIIATVPSAPPPTHPDEQLISDLDLSILASTPEIYDAYARAVRQEYAFVSEPDFARGRVAVMSGFLDRERIYLTKAFRHHEKRARENVAREIAAWKGRG